MRLDVSRLTGCQIVSTIGLIGSVWLVFVYDIFTGSRALLPEKTRSTRRHLETSLTSLHNSSTNTRRTGRASQNSAFTQASTTMDQHRSFKAFLNSQTSHSTAFPDNVMTFTKRRHGSRRGRCGDGIVDPDEDCDESCGGSPNCLKTAGQCCNSTTCKFRTGAQCSPRHGPCCTSSCQFKKSHQVCRPAKNSCDLPELCSGHTESCASDAFRQNGEECADALGYCFNRKCITRNDQCEQVWGMHSSSARDECYSHFNGRGVFNGNCGLTHRDTSYEYKPCMPEDVQCGALQCKGGGQSPLASLSSSHTFSATIWANISGRVFQCKTISPEVVTPEHVAHTLVHDGTKCGSDKMCLKGRCIYFRHMLPPNHCPRGDSALTCSGQGICSDLNSCSCHSGYFGPVCSEIGMNQTAVTLWGLHQNTNMLNLRRGTDGKHRRTLNEVVDNDSLQIVVIVTSALILGATVVIMSLTCCRNNRGTHSQPGHQPTSPAMDSVLSGSVV